MPRTRASSMLCTFGAADRLSSIQTCFRRRRRSAGSLNDLPIAPARTPSRMSQLRTRRMRWARRPAVGAAIATLTLGGPVPRKHNGHGAQQDREVEQQRRRTHIRQIEAVHLHEAQAAAATDLPQARDPRLHEKPAVDPVAVLRDGVRNVRAGTDEAHLAAEHVPELRQLVEARLAKESADPRDPGIVGDFVNGARRALLHQAADERAVRTGIRVGAHRPELDDFEAAAVATDPLAAVEDRPWTFEPDRDRD